MSYCTESHCIQPIRYKTFIQCKMYLSKNCLCVYMVGGIMTNVSFNNISYYICTYRGGQFNKRR